MKRNLVLWCVLLVLIHQIDAESEAVTESADKFYKDQDNLITRLQGFLENVMDKIRQLNGTVMKSHAQLKEKINVQVTNTSLKISYLFKSRNVSESNDLFADSREGIENATRSVEKKLSGCLDKITITLTAAILEAEVFHSNPLLLLAFAIDIPHDKPWNEFIEKFEIENKQLAEERLQNMKSEYTECVSASMLAFEISLAKVVESTEKCMVKL